MAQALKTQDNYWRLFNVLPGRKLEFLVNSKTFGGGRLDGCHHPAPAVAQSNLEYNLWVENRKEMVEKLIHRRNRISAYPRHGCAFAAEISGRSDRQPDKKALIIDQRFNGGGGIDQELLEILNQRKQYQVTRRTRFDRHSTARAGLLRPHGGAAERALGERCRDVPGRLPPAGARQTCRRADHGRGDRHGSLHAARWFAIAHTGFGRVFTASGEDMENYGVQPDVLVDNGPADFLAGRDRQVEKAIEVLRDGVEVSEIRNSQPLSLAFICVHLRSFGAKCFFSYPGKCPDYYGSPPQAIWHDAVGE